MNEDPEKHPAGDQGPDEIKVPWTVKDALAGMAMVAAATVLAFAVVVLDRGVSDSENTTLVTTMALSLLSAFMVLSAWLFGVRRYRTTWTTLGFARSRARRSLLLPWVTLVLSLAFGGLYVAIVMAVDIDSLVPPTIPQDALGEGLQRSVNVVLIGLVGPLAEEVFFRGFLLAALVQPLGALRAATVASFIFAAYHGSLATMVPIFVSGLLLSWLYLKTRSLWPPLTAHAAQNLIALSRAA